MVVQLTRPALRLLSGLAACTGRQLVCLHGTGNQSPTRRGENVRASGPRRVSWTTPQSESRSACVRWRLLVWGGDFSCEVESCRVRPRLLGGGPSSRELVRDAPNWSGAWHLASEGLDRGPQSSSPWALAFTLSMVSENLVLVRHYLAVKGVLIWALVTHPTVVTHGGKRAANGSLLGTGPTASYCCVPWR
jgi:hypothetical protein